MSKLALALALVPALALFPAFLPEAGGQTPASQTPVSQTPVSQTPGGRMVTQGLATEVAKNLFACAANLPNYRAAPVGRIRASDGTMLTVPAETAYERGPKLADLFNQCTGPTPETFDPKLAETAPLVEIDADGEIVTGYVMADNYFELYVNGKLVGVDRTPYTPFNSSIVRFKAKRPYTYALKLVDWEERLGLGGETNAKGDDYWPGDGGLIARFSDGTRTDASWKAQSFYIAPLSSPEEVVEEGGLHRTATLGRTYPEAKPPLCKDRCYAVHYALPERWAAADFDDSAWPQAFEFTDSQVGTDHLPAYTRYPEAFRGARWIWSYNLVFDNLVLARKTVR